MENGKLKCNLYKITLMSLPKWHLLMTSVLVTGTAIILVLVDQTLSLLDLFSLTSPIPSFPHHIKFFASMSTFQFYSVSFVLSLKFFAWGFLDHTNGVIQTTNLHKNYFVAQFF